MAPGERRGERSATGGPAPLSEHAAQREGLLSRIEEYLDAAPRSAATTEQVGPFTVFVKGPGTWSYYARPSPGSRDISAGDVEDVRRRQRELGLAETFEWLADLQPDLASTLREAGLDVIEYPLLVLPEGASIRAPTPEGFEVRLAGPGDDLARLQAVPALAFANPGTAPGTVGLDDLPPAAERFAGEAVAFLRARVEEGLTVAAAAWQGEDPVSVGMHQPVGGVSEVVGVGTLPAFRRRGLGAGVTAALVEDALRLGVQTVFLTAGNQEIARVYERVGFRRVGTAGAAAPPSEG